MSDKLLFNDLYLAVYTATKEDAAKIVENLKTNEPNHPALPEVERLYNEK